MSKAITEQQEERHAREAAAAAVAGPSVLVEDQPTVARGFGLVGGVFAIIGGVCLGMAVSGRGAVLLGPGWATLVLTVGLFALLYHAATDKDAQFRLIYLVLAAVFLAAGVLLALLPYPTRMGDQFGYGLVGMFLGLLFGAAVLRNETDASLRNAVQLGLLGAGAALALIGVVGGAVSKNFLQFGLLLALMGLLYLVAFINSRGVADTLGYRAGLGVGALGLLTLLVALARSVFGPLFHSWKWLSGTGWDYFIPFGLLWATVGLIYLAACWLMCSQRPLAAMTRRELGAFFYSPMAYIVLFGFTVAAWVGYVLFVVQLTGGDQPLMEPIVRYYIFSILPVITMIFIVPVLTMRLLSEEQRTGTMEVLLTAPVDEVAVVMSKFLAGMGMYLAVWVPFFLLLVGLWVGGKPFDVYPLMAFGFGLVVTGAGFVSMGLFCSSLTRNQVASGVLSFAGMLALTMVYIFKNYLERSLSGGESSSFWAGFFSHISYLDYWQAAIEGKLQPIPLVFFASMTVFFLFLSVKVLESRKWR
jgi:ABC-type transport system involved in multi-copper enzyme maturation permease subunit